MASDAAVTAAADANAAARAEEACLATEQAAAARCAKDSEAAAAQRQLQEEVSCHELALIDARRRIQEAADATRDVDPSLHSAVDDGAPSAASGDDVLLPNADIDTVSILHSQALAGLLGGFSGYGLPYLYQAAHQGPQ
ncbi:hypothetical protein GUJ93_ZPchr0010g9100 [Zizania palustris]|uniref:Uncharacterized protein n=1 Tax=Zizania palustris TaxID=103762 RepID=A0A8J6BPA0_ZIZPA|nr:hypothetical protein GUJ93_ZPchr0010g9100 [Zizania palustris]